MRPPHTGSVPSQNQGSLKEKMAAHVFTGDARKSHGDNPLIAFALAASAGVGQVDDQFVTPEFGARVMIAAIATDATLDSLKPTQPVTVSRPKKPGAPAALKNALWSKATANLVSPGWRRTGRCVDQTVPALKSWLTSIPRQDDHDTTLNRHIHGKWCPKSLAEDIKLRTPRTTCGRTLRHRPGMHIPQVILTMQARPRAVRSAPKAFMSTRQF